MIDKKNRYQTILKVIVWIAIVGIGIMMYMDWNNIPSIVGIHVNLGGQVDNYGNKSVLVIAWVVMIVINLLYTFDYKFNYANGNGNLFKKFPWLYHTLYVVAIVFISVFMIARMLGR
ncbi:MAG: DUF1648 domain-containing protein [Coprobacillus sp.]